MKLYLLNILQNNELEDVMNEGFAALLTKYNGVVYQTDPKEAFKYLGQFAFEKEEERNGMADEIPQIAFEFATLYDYPEETWEKYKSGEKVADPNPMPEGHKPSRFEEQIDKWLKENEFKNLKLWNETIDWYITLPNGKKAVITLEYGGKFVIGGVYREKMVACKDKRQMGEAIQRLFSEIEKASASSIVD